MKMWQALLTLAGIGFISRMRFGGSQVLAGSAGASSGYGISSSPVGMSSLGESLYYEAKGRASGYEAPPGMSSLGKQLYYEAVGKALSQ